MTKVSSDEITAELRKNIYEGVLASGVALKQEDLAEKFGVSRIPIREALKRLEAEGLVQHELNKGTVVASHSISEVIEMLDIRIGLETRALQLAIPNLDKQHLDRCEAILARYDGASKPSVWSALNLEFHLTLYSAANKPRLIKMIEDLVLGMQRYTRIYISHTLGREQPQKEHYELLETLRRGDAEKAISLLEEHIARTQEVILASQDD
ncbi:MULTISPECIES: GntR family transcriptional regulator [unclassified Herbaspirillum]|nr:MULTISPECIES: GntR family transcriptional regulator [unclassified Herbaspirillum]RFB71184.1 GntR family transcriptional regulator [Herbaspirillum sp. 3R-3a1]TFI08279.1 GntR family transcriptional regulator [Herbaspirillum sp. 3R11]TFI14694.1 GntR family transcriptional regulator [Herbaspirillum sp. 3R-11]TFI31914.1 GntR family transcriptional regulator [Herbaspirillum sp. 3C11]TFI32003.1 GntR family transcriptional regulator [Herbaspirillum sp. 3C11]